MLDNIKPILLTKQRFTVFPCQYGSSGPDHAPVGLCPGQLVHLDESTRGVQVVLWRAIVPGGQVAQGMQHAAAQV